MKDREFLIWIHESLSNVYDESECADYMHKLRAIIKRTPEDQYTPNCNTCNSMKEFLREFFKDLE